MKNDKDCRVWQLTTTREAQDGFFLEAQGTIKCEHWKCLDCYVIEHKNWDKVFLVTGKKYIKKKKHFFHQYSDENYHHHDGGRASQGNCINNGEANRGNVPTLDAFPPYSSCRFWGL